VIDGFAVWARIRREHARDAASLRAAAPTPPRPRIAATADGFALRF
jgi:hypothetical protein